MVSREKAETVRRLLLKRKQKSITRQSLAILAGTETEKDLYFVIQLLESEGVLKPYKTRRSTNGSVTHPIADKYHILISDDFSDILSDMRLLHPKILRNGYLVKNKQKYRENKAKIDTLSEYLYKASRSDKRVYNEKISKKARSFLIFGEEKVIESDKDRGIQSLLNAIGLDAENLLYYETPANDFVSFIPVRKEEMNILICENKDIFYDIRKLMFEHGKKTFFRADIDGVVYGQGKDIAAKGVLTEFTNLLGIGSAKYLYCGDIDREGIRIYESLCRANPELEIRLFKEMYEAMADEAESLERMEDSDDHRALPYDFSDTLAVIGGTHRKTIESCIEQNKRIPQEILNYVLLDENSRI